MTDSPLPTPPPDAAPVTDSGNSPAKPDPVFLRSEVLGTIALGLLLIAFSGWLLVPPILDQRERQFIADHGMESSAVLIRQGDPQADGRVLLTFEYPDVAGNTRETTRLAKERFRRAAEITRHSRTERLLIRYLRDQPERVMFLDEAPAPTPAPWVHSLAIVGLLMLSYATGRVLSLSRTRRRARASATPPS